MPVWVLIAVIGAGYVDAAYDLDILQILSQQWVQQLLTAMGLGGIPLSILKRLIDRSKELRASKDDIPELVKQTLTELGINFKDSSKTG